jgi:DNA-binding response OmpR family regulator
MISASPARPPRVLVLEDEAIILMAIESTLAEANYDVETASTSEEALAKLDTHSFDVALLDVGLRSGNSLLVADALLKRAVPFAFSTGTSVPIPAAFAGIPVNSKPFPDNELLALIGSMLAPR